MNLCDISHVLEVDEICTSPQIQIILLNTKNLLRGNLNSRRLHTKQYYNRNKIILLLSVDEKKTETEIYGIYIFQSILISVNLMLVCIDFK